MVVLPIVLLVSLAVGAGYFRLSQGPVSLNFLAKPVKSGIDQGLPGLSATFDDVIVTLAETGGLELRLANLKLTESSGDVVVTAPQAAIELSASGLWSLSAQPERVELIEPRIALLYSRASGFALSFDGGSVQTEPDRIRSTLGVAPSAGRKENLDLAEIFNSVSASQSGGQTSSLRELGLRNATLLLDAEGRKTSWQIPQFLIAADRQWDRSVIDGSARVSSAGRIWSASFRVENELGAESFSLVTSIQDFVPKNLSEAVPGLDMFALFDRPASADIRATFDRSGALQASTLAVDIAGSRLQLKDMARPLLEVEAGVLNFAYVPAERRIRLERSTLRGGRSVFAVDGEFSQVGQSGSAYGATLLAAMDGDWEFAMRLVPAAERDVAPEEIGIQSGRLRGVFRSADEVVEVGTVEIGLLGGQIKLAGEFSVGDEQAAKWQGDFSGMPVAQLAAVWPDAIADGGREWLVENVQQGRIDTGSFSYLSGRHLQGVQPTVSVDASRMVVTAEVSSVLFNPLAGLPPVSAERVLAQFENDRLEVSFPEGLMDVGSGRVIALKQSSFVGSEMFGAAPSGEVAFKFDGPAGGVRSLFDLPPLAAATQSTGEIPQLEGAITGTAKIGFPLDREVLAADVGYEVKARLKDGTIADAFDGQGVKGASLDLHVTPQAINAKGDILIKGVAAKLNWQRIQGADGARQPPMRVTATLDASDRKQLGVDFGDAVVGDVPVVVSVSNPGAVDESVHFRADLTPARLAISSIGWEKPAGRQAFLDFDVAGDADGGASKGTKTLKNVQITGSDIAIEGSIELDSSGQAVAFDFPRFSLNLVSRMSAKGRRDRSKRWKVNVNGKTFAGQKFFRSLFSVGDAKASGRAKQSGGSDFDIAVKIENVIGFQDLSLRGLDMTVASRAGRLTQLNGRGVLDGGKPLAFELRGGGGKSRRLLVDTSDAGTAFKLIGFYPNMVNGRLRLEIDLEGRGAAEKTGTLWVENFKVLGDQVISEVVGNPDEAVPAIARRRKVVRQEFQFERLRAPFMVGHGQIVIEDASLHGQLLGATLRGKADFNRKTVDLGGTYVLLQGLNNMFAPIPVFGELLSGPRKEGLFGTNFAIRGRMENPQVYVHPLSALAPGIFREIFQMAPEAQQVSPGGGLNYGKGLQIRSSSSPATVGRTPTNGLTVDGWNSTTQKKK